MSHRTDWFHAARWGLFAHYLADAASAVTLPDETVEGWNARVESFDAEALAAQVAETGAGYFFLTLGQNSGFYCSPNATYDRLVGIQPSKLSRRDLVADVQAALAKRDVRMMVYLPAGAPRQDETAVAALEWTNGPHRNREFQQKWEAVITEWSTRWGNRVSGWWFDGCYWPAEMYPEGEEPNFRSFSAAARAGNPNSLVAFNPGVLYPVIALTEHEDYTSGEIDDPTKVETPGRWLNSEQYQLLSYLGRTWGQGDPRFEDAWVAEWTRRQCAAGAVLTWDVPVAHDGHLPEAHRRQLAAIGKAVAK